MPKKGDTNNPHGRPPLPEGERKDVVIQLGRATAGERDELKSAAERSGKSFTQWALEILLRAARRK